jgi:hypothetical protein
MTPSAPGPAGPYDEALRRSFTRTPDATIDGRPRPTYRRSDFRISWFATRVHTFAFVVEMDAIPSVAALTSVGKQARQHAIAAKGGLPRGLQTGSAAMPIVVVPEVTDEIARWASEPQPLEFAAPLFPIVVDATGARVAYRMKSQKIGIIYEKFFRSVAADVVGPATGG